MALKYQSQSQKAAAAAAAVGGDDGISELWFCGHIAFKRYKENINKKRVQ